MCNCKNGICVCWANQYSYDQLNFDLNKADQQINEALKEIDKVKEMGEMVYAIQRLFGKFTPEEGSIIIGQLEEKYPELKS